MNNQILFLGDSHAAFICKRLREMHTGVHIYGNMLQLKPLWQQHFHRGDDTLEFSGAAARATFRAYIRHFGLESDNLLDVDVPMVLSFTSIQNVIHYGEWRTYSPFADFGQHFLSDQIFENILGVFYSHTFAFFERLVAANKSFVSIISPGARHSEFRAGDLFMKTRKYLIQEFGRRNIPFVDATEQTCDAHGQLQEPYWNENPADFFHANGAWGEIIGRQCFEHFNISPALPKLDS